MQCEEFESKLMRDPQNEDEAFHHHRLSCANCQAQYEEIMQLEDKLANAFELQTERDFVKKIEQKVTADVVSAKRKRKRFYALAASIMLLVTVGVTSLHLYKNRSLPAFVLAHIDHEIEHLNSRVAVNQAYLDHLVERFDAEFLRVFQDITYAERCWMRTGYGLHLIFKGHNGPVTLLWMPAENISQPLIVESDNLQGKVYTVKDGSFALVGYQGEPIEMLAESLRMAIRL